LEWADNFSFLYTGIGQEKQLANLASFNLFLLARKKEIDKDRFYVMKLSFVEDKTDL
jgi:hypothetical protein